MLQKLLAMLLIFGATVVLAVDFPAGNFNFTTNVGGTYDGPSAFGGQGDPQLANRFLATSNLNSPTIRFLDYTDEDANYNWLVLDTPAVSNTVLFVLTNIRAGHSAVIADNTNYTFIRVDRQNDPSYGLLTNNTGLLAVIRNASTGWMIIDLVDGGNIYANGSNAGNPAIASPNGPLDIYDNGTTGANAIIGTITAKGGSITLKNNHINGAVTSNTDTFNVTLNGTGTIYGAIAASGNGLLTIGSAGVYTPASTISGFTDIDVYGSFTTNGNISGITGALDIFLNGTANLGHTVTGTGTTNNSGTLNITATNALGLTGLFTNSGTTNLNATVSAATALTNTSTGTVNVNVTNALGFTGLFTNAGITNINASLSRANATTNTGTTDIDSTFTFTNTGALTLNNGTKTTAGAITGAGALTNSSAGTFTFNDASTYTTPATGALNFTGLFTNAGIFQVQQSVTRASNTTNTGNIAISDGKTFTNTATLTLNNGTQTVVGAISGLGGLTNTGTFTFNDASVYTTRALMFTGLFTNQGTFQVKQNVTRANATTNTGTISIDSGKTFTNTGALDGTGGTMSGLGAFTNTSPGTYTVTGSDALSFTGTFANSGTVNIQGDASRGGATNNTGTITIGTGNTFTNTGALDTTGGGIINGGGGLTNSSTGTFTLNTSNGLAFGTSTGGLFSNAGTTTISATASRASGAATTNTGTISISTGAVFTSSGVFDGTGGTMSGLGGFTNAIGGSYTVTGNAGLSFTGTFTNVGTTYINGSLTRNDVTGNTGTITIAEDVTFTNNGGFTDTGGTLDGGGAFTNTADYVISGSSALSFTGLFTNSSNVVISGDASRSGDTTNTGNIAISSGKTFTNSGTLTFDVGTKTTVGALSGAGNLTNASGGIIDFKDTATYVAPATTALMLSGTLTNNGTINISAGSFAPVGNLVNNSAGIINISGTGVLTKTSGLTNSGTTNILRSNNAIVGNYSGTTGAILNVGSITPTVVNAAFTLNGTIVGIPTINVANGSSITALSTSENISGVATSFNLGTSVGGGATASFDGAGLSGGGTLNNYGTMSFVNANAGLDMTGAINNYATMTFNTSSVLTPNFSVINMFDNSTFTLNNGLPTNLGSKSITAGDSITGTTLNINGASTILSTSGLINNIKNITVGTNATLQLDNGGQVTGNNTSGGRTINLAGTLAINSGGSFTISSADVINGTTATNGIGNGGITNNGTLLIDGSDLTLGGAFTNGTTGVFTINGVPTLTFTGAVTNQGTIFATFNESNNIPQIITSAAPSLSAGLIVIGYQNNYIADGAYPFISGYTGLVAVGAYSLPQPSTYIAGWSLTSTGSVGNPGAVNVEVDRIGFGNVATDPEAKEIGFYLETLGENNPSQEILDLLNVLEQITDPAELNIALLALAIPEYVPLQALSMMQDVLNTVQGRIAHVRTGFSVGDADSDRSVWVRPFVSSGRQQQKDNLQGYTARVNGFAFGVDNDITDRIMLGAAGSIAKSKVTDQVVVNSHTDISSYQAMIYGTVRSKSDAYLDWIIAGGVNNYHGSRGISTATLTAEYSGQQFTLKAIGSKSYVWKKYYQLTPLASAQYSFLRQMPFAEVGSGFGRVITPSNVNLLELGVGGQASVPFSQKKVTSIPEIHAMVLVDVKGGAIDTNSQFISGGPIISTTVQPGRLIGRIGASLTFAVSDRLQVIANYDFETRSKYISNEVYVNVKYTF